jgi:hypothetical protein
MSVLPPWFITSWIYHHYFVQHLSPCEEKNAVNFHGVSTCLKYLRSVSSWFKTRGNEIKQERCSLKSRTVAGKRSGPGMHFLPCRSSPFSFCPSFLRYLSILCSRVTFKNHQMDLGLIFRKYSPTPMLFTVLVSPNTVDTWSLEVKWIVWWVTTSVNRMICGCPPSLKKPLFSLLGISTHFRTHHKISCVIHSHNRYWEIKPAIPGKQVFCMCIMFFLYQESDSYNIIKCLKQTNKKLYWNFCVLLSSQRTTEEWQSKRLQVYKNWGNSYSISLQN